MSRLVTPTNVVAVRGDRRLELPERLAAEEPMEIRVGGPGDEPTAVGVTMRTPGHDFELAVGFLHSEGVVASGTDISSVRYCDTPPDEEQRFNVVTVRLARPAELEGVQRASSITSSCGVCGTATLDQLRRRCDPLPPGPSVGISTILALPDALRSAQQVFDQTGGLHAAGLADADGTVLVREDVGRHNAVDKLVGRSLLDGAVPLRDRILVVSGRVSFEIVQKAALAGIPVVAAVSAPSSLAVTTARDLGLTVVAFIRSPRANVYSHPERVDFAR